MKQMITTLPMKRHGMGNNAPRLMTLRDDCDASDEHYTGSTRAARQRSGEGREAGEAVAVFQAAKPRSREAILSVPSVTSVTHAPDVSIWLTKHVLFSVTRAKNGA